MGGDVGVPLQKGLIRQKKGQGDFSDVSVSEVKSTAGSCRMHSGGCLLRQDRGPGLELSWKRSGWEHSKSRQHSVPFAASLY